MAIEKQAPPVLADMEIRIHQSTIEVEPEIRLGDPFVWDIVAGGTEQVTITFTRGNGGNPGNPTRPGPFPKRPGDPHNPNEGEYQIVGPGQITTEPAQLRGRWKYTITWSAGQLDPLIIVR